MINNHFHDVLYISNLLGDEGFDINSKYAKTF